MLYFSLIVLLHPVLVEIDTGDFGYWVTVIGATHPRT